MVRQITSWADLNHLIHKAAANHLIVLDFYADWCPPCRAIGPFFEQISGQYINATFLKVNVDISQDIARNYGVSAMPTFVFIKGTQEVARIAGANPSGLQQTIQQHYADAAPNPFQATTEERTFLDKYAIIAEKQMRYYKDIVNKTLALSLIPSEDLMNNATIDGKVNRYELAKELLQWFKTDLFTWCDSPICEHCEKQTPHGTGVVGIPNDEERQNDASRVEIYKCEQCQREVRFPRYNNPAKLLDTRTGRCGEWANCFCLIAAAMDFDIRYIHDITDHVWCELWIPEFDRWIHCDPCENAIDTPFMYEKGWNKKLSYVFAVGLDSINDVTWNYTTKHKEVMKRRTNVREPVLLNFTIKLTKRMLGNSPNPERKKEIDRRRVLEVIRSIQIGNTQDIKTYEGRSTGSAEWRAARGELGISPKKKPSIVIRPNDEELGAKKLRITYNSAKDSYIRGSSITKNWSSLIFKSKDIMRKVEADWKMAYLCRKEEKEEGEITWAIDLTGVKALKASVKIYGVTVYESGNVALSVCADDICLPVPKSGELVVADPPSSLLKITAYFTGGNGSNSFQHAQLFRSPLDNKEDEQLVIEINFA